jgi:hypothetical protein
MAHPKQSCPRCNRLLEAAGVITFQGREFPSYQCDECLKTVDLFGEKMQVALTFCVDDQGKPFDPAD